MVLTKILKVFEGERLKREYYSAEFKKKIFSFL